MPMLIYVAIKGPIDPPVERPAHQTPPQRKDLQEPVENPPKAKNR